MDLITIISIAAATITVSTTVYLVYRRFKNFLKAFDQRLVAIEDSFKIREELTLIKEIVVKNEENNRLYTLKVGTTVIVYDIQNDVVDFVTSNRLIRAKANVENFIQEKNK